MSGRGDLRGALVGAAIAGVFGALWALWGASGLAAPASTIVRVAGILLGLAVVVEALRGVRTAPRSGGDGSMFRTPRYRLIVLGEVIALVVGGVVLGRVGLPQYVCPWVALVVGAHFLAFGRAFWRGFYLIGLAFVGAALVGTVVGLVGGAPGAVIATTALISSASLLVAGGRTVVRA
ncbi:MAG TPA: hypothetical protein VGO23_11960 [Pseudonocardia sp.]|nr:hypothetical protein [Pseudonocardia sp.]